MIEAHSHIGLDDPGIYEIRVQGLISQSWLKSFQNLCISVVGEDGWAVTTLVGQVIDQAALQGILQQLYTLNLVLLSIDRKES
jgi:hypothetical protein